MGYDYFPNNRGHYVIYECDSIVHNSFQKDTFKYQIREVIDSIYFDNQGRKTMRIVRYKRTDTSIPWSNILIPEKVWTGNLLSNMAIRLEDNYQYIKLLFPMSLNETWNGNALNSMSAWNYQYTTLHTPYTLTNSTGSVHFDSTLTVAQQNFSSLLQYQYYYEQYATGIGMIYKEVIDYSNPNFLSVPPPVNDSATSGVWYTETYLSSGN